MVTHRPSQPSSNPNNSADAVPAKSRADENAMHWPSWPPRLEDFPDLVDGLSQLARTTANEESAQLIQKFLHVFGHCLDSTCPRSSRFLETKTPSTVSVSNVSNVEEGAVVPERTQRQEHLDEKTRTTRAVRSILNKITPTTYQELSEEFLNLEVFKNNEILVAVVDVFFDKAIEDRVFCTLYADLIQLQINSEMIRAHTSLFRNTIIGKCQTTFEDFNNKRQAIKIIMKMEMEADEEKKANMKAKLAEKQNKHKRRFLGNLVLMAELYRHNIIRNVIMRWCVVHLLYNADKDKVEDYTEYAIKLLTNIGKIWYQRDRCNQFPVDFYVYHLQRHAQEYSKRLQFMIMDLVDLKRRKWVPRKQNISRPLEAEAIRHKVVQQKMLQQKMLPNPKTGTSTPESLTGFLGSCLKLVEQRDRRLFSKMEADLQAICSRYVDVVMNL
ncbi:hypothetical protein QR680_000174 [Steinernema hermaphroditum]|uniref:MIF4G domain-containing protein n=1 Tax=Steinernema hermaphroditum TaxID=289476 RepID=A0AA39LDP8_9BILA|nr:hypothetical protein QR680_000174 [Steinernema hermaphroditum]